MLMTRNVKCIFGISIFDCRSFQCLISAKLLNECPRLLLAKREISWFWLVLMVVLFCWRHHTVTNNIQSIYFVNFPKYILYDTKLEHVVRFWKTEPWQIPFLTSNNLINSLNPRIQTLPSAIKLLVNWEKKVAQLHGLIWSTQLHQC